MDNQLQSLKSKLEDGQFKKARDFANHLQNNKCSNCFFFWFYYDLTVRLTDYEPNTIKRIQHEFEKFDIQKKKLEYNKENYEALLCLAKGKLFYDNKDPHVALDWLSKANRYWNKISAPNQNWININRFYLLKTMMKITNKRYRNDYLEVLNKIRLEDKDQLRLLRSKLIILGNLGNTIDDWFVKVYTILTQKGPYE